MAYGKKQNYLLGLIEKVFSMYTKKNDMPAFEKPADQLEFEDALRTPELSDLCKEDGRFYYTVLVSTIGNTLITSSEDVRNLETGQGYYTISLPTKLKCSSPPGYKITKGMRERTLGILFDNQLKEYPIKGARLVPGSVMIKEMEISGSGAATVGRVGPSVPTYLDDLRKASGPTGPGTTTPGYIDDKNTSYDIVGSSGTGGLIGASGTGGHINFTATSGSAGLTDSYDTSDPLMREYLVEKGFYKNK